jgi:Mg2+ and Co2+ transporter CorA
MTAAQRDHREHQVARWNREDLSVLLELRDVEDELGSILKLLEQQDTVIKSMTKYFDDKGYGKEFLNTAQGRIDEYRSQINEMKENSHLAQKAVSVTFPCLRLLASANHFRSKHCSISSRNKRMSMRLKWPDGKPRLRRRSRGLSWSSLFSVLCKLAFLRACYNQAAF